MNKQEILSQSLPKWPALVVVGKNVTKDQAKEILIKTCDLEHFSTNDKNFQFSLYEYLYRVKKQDGYCYCLANYFNDDWNKADEAAQKIIKITGNISRELEYLQNEQICSCWIGGPHGWCDWSGKIGTNNYNIGKWPSCETVYKEWKLIAKTFPYLNLTAQLFSGENGEENTKAIIEFKIKNGKVKVCLPEEKFIRNEEIDYTSILNDNWERGCTLEQFAEAYEYVINKIDKPAEIH